MKNYVIYTDGGCRPNPGFGACAFAILEDGKTLVHKQAYKKESTTNNEMEMSAIIAALMWVEKNAKDCRIYINTDSQYVQLGITKWIINWKKRNWKTSNKKPIKNLELWKKLDKLNANLDIHYQWVKGHSGNEWNDYVDEMCTAKIRQYNVDAL